MGSSTRFLSHAGEVKKQSVGGFGRLFPILTLLAATLALPGGLFGQQFEHIDQLYFIKPFGGTDPLPQILPIASTAANFGFTITPTSTGNWLSASPSGACCVTPRGVSVIVTTGAAMAVGTYNGQISFTAGGTVTALTVAVTLVITATNGTFFDNMPGQVSFSMKPGGQPPPQVLQIRNGGTGSLAWSLSTTTFNSSNWLNVSATSGTAPSVITVSIVAANLPNGGATAAQYSGQLLFQTAGGASIVSVPIGVTVAANAMPQINALSFTKVFGGKDPLPQTVTIANGLGGASFGVTILSQTATGSTGGTWLDVSPDGACCATPRAITISPTPAITLAAGTYTGQVTFDNGTQLMVVPVTLSVSAASSAFFDNMAGQLSFFLSTGASNTPPNQLLQIRNAGTGTLTWSLTTTTFDSGSWLTVSETTDTAPTQISVGIVPANLPNGALTAGTFTANLLFQGGGTSITVPVTVQVGPSFEQINGINFTMTQNGANPLPQNITIAGTTAASFGFNVAFDTATGGSWLSVSPTGACCATPRALEVSVTAAPTMPAGTYTGEIIVYSGTTSMTVPVTLTVATSATPYFDNVPGEMTFSMQTAAPHPPPNQVFQIRNAGSGTLNWTLATNTFDGGNWLTVSTLAGLPAPSGTAPEIVSVGIVPGNLPNGGLVAGVFTGQLLLQAGGSSYTIPVMVDVGTDVFGQMGGINFSMQQAGANPLTQVLTVTGTGASFGFNVDASTANGGNWLTVTPAGACCSTPYTSFVSINAPPTMPAGIYTGQVSYYSGTVSQTVPVTLTVSPANTSFFDNVPGALNFSLATGVGGTAVNPPPQIVGIRNRGTGTLNWTAQTSTFDGGNWLTVSASSGTAPTLVSIGIVSANLPNAGLVAGLYTGQILFLEGNSSSVTVPVSVLVGGNGFIQNNPISFTMPQNGANPLPQTLTIVGTGASIGMTVSTATGNGGSWMTVSPAGACCSTPYVITATVSAPVAMPAGTYTSEIIVDTSRSVTVIPVTLTVEPLTVPFFDNVQGQMSFFAPVAGNPASQSMQIRNFGSGLLGWTLTPITADTGNWLVPSITSGTAPATINVAINPQNLPNQGLVAGQFTGQLLFQSGSGSVTVPVSLQLGTDTYTQQAGLNFSMAYGGGSPLPQALSVTASGTPALGLNVSDSEGNGGNWLSLAPSGACCATPSTITFTVAGAPGGVAVPAGIHTGQAVFTNSRAALTVPVTLTVSGTPKLTITKTHVGNFTPGQQNAMYTVTVSNQTGASVGLTNGAVTVTETAPAGMTLVSMTGNNWTCPANPGNTCTRSDSIASGNSYDPITVTVNVATTVSLPVTNNVSVTGGGSVIANASDVTGIVTKCDVDQDGNTTISEIQSIIDQALGLAAAVNDLNKDGVINLLDVQIVVNAALGLGCAAM